MPTRDRPFTALLVCLVGFATASLAAGSLVVAGPTAGPSVAVTTPEPPPGSALTGDSLSRFITHHATVHYSNTGVLGGFARWLGGRAETLCPATLGLDPGYNDFVTARLRAVAAFVGAPVQADPHCRANVLILFTTKPGESMAQVAKWAGASLGSRYPHQIDKQLELSGTHPVQGWYLTAGGGPGVLNSDPALVGSLSFLPLWPLVIQSGLRGGFGGSSLFMVILVIDTTRVAGYTIGSIADYLTLLALTEVQTPDHCDALPSILDLMASDCEARPKAAALTAGDLAFLKALYFHNTGLGPTLSRDDIQLNMMHQFQDRP